MGSKEMAEKPNKYFVSVFMVEDMSYIPKIHESQLAEVSMVVTTKEKVLEELNGLKVDKSLGSDGLHPRVLEEIAEEIVEVLVVIFQEFREDPRGLEN
eukprot:g18857.t1